MQSNTKGKKKRRGKGKYWVSQYSGNNIIHAYKRHFKIPLITAVNDLEAIGVKLHESDVARIKMDRHYSNQQHLSKEKLQELSEIMKYDSEYIE